MNPIAIPPLSQPRLFTPLTLRGLTLPNRIVVSPMCQYRVTDGLAGSWHRIHLGGLALSGAGMLTLESTAVEAEGRITPADLGLWNDPTEAALGQMLASIREHSPIAVALQLGHAGRKASSQVPWLGGQLIAPEQGGWRPHAPSALPHKADEPAPIELDEAGLTRVREAFAAAARRAARLGFDALEVHMGHGYLLHEFLSSIANRRSDAYGGSLENRMRFPLEVFDAIRAVFPADKPVGVKVSATDWVEGGWDIEQTVAFAAELKKHGVDWVVTSSGGVSPLQKIALGPGYQLPFAEAVKARTGVATGAVGLITDPRAAEAIIARGQADFVEIARGMLYDPRWGWHAAAELGAQVSAPPQYWRAPPHEHKELFGGTAFGAR